MDLSIFIMRQKNKNENGFENIFVLILLLYLVIYLIHILLHFAWLLLMTCQHEADYVWNPATSFVLND